MNEESHLKAPWPRRGGAKHSVDDDDDDDYRLQTTDYTRHTTYHILHTEADCGCSSTFSL